jgi:2-polyprenyl-3-methyl-5-hydroxy-6-metoxy-1,4-benzoquinol methylase
MTDAGEHDIPRRDQIAYYQARAGEYDEWFYRQGRYDRGPELNQWWFAEIEQIRKALDEFGPAGRVLEFACGTGLWTAQLLGHAEHVTAVDVSREMLGITKSRLQSGRVRYVQADIFDWRTAERYDAIFFSFWLSHVPPERFGHFWQLVDQSLAPGGRVFFVDSRYNPNSTAHNHQLEGAEATTTTRRLNDGREYRIVKIFYEAHRLAKQLAVLGWDFTIDQTAHYFLYGRGGRQAGGA